MNKSTATLQDASLLEFQRRWEKEHNRSNLQAIFKIHATPCDAQFRKVLDKIPLENIEKIFHEIFKIAQRNKILEEYVFLDGNYFIPIDGSEYFSSASILCPHCLIKGKKHLETLELDPDSNVFMDEHTNRNYVVRYYH